MGDKMSLIRQINIGEDVGYFWPFVPSISNDSRFYKIMIDGTFFVFTNYIEYDIDDYIKSFGGNNSGEIEDTILTLQSKWFWDKVFEHSPGGKDWDRYYGLLLYPEGNYRYIDFTEECTCDYVQEDYIEALGGII